MRVCSSFRKTADRVVMFHQPDASSWLLFSEKVLLIYNYYKSFIQEINVYDKYSSCQVTLSPS